MAVVFHGMAGGDLSKSLLRASVYSTIKWVHLSHLPHRGWDEVSHCKALAQGVAYGQCSRVLADTIAVSDMIVTTIIIIIIKWNLGQRMPTSKAFEPDCL